MPRRIHQIERRQSSLEERPSAPREWAEGRRGSNQSDGMPGIVQEALACFEALATISDLGISSRSHRLAYPCSGWNRLQLDGGMPRLHSFYAVARKRFMSKTRSLLRRR